jgi:RNA polymerase sigma factor (sigma-70 family)
LNRLSPVEIIEGLRKRDSRVLKYIYKTCLEPVQHMILNNNGTQEDAKDIFQEAIIIAFRNVMEDNQFGLKSSFQTYIYSIARLLWLKHLRISRKNMKNFNENHEYIDFVEPQPFTSADLKYSLYQKTFLELPDDCQKILKLFLDGVPQKEIANLLGYKSENYISKRKHFCKEYLIKKIKENPDYQPD